MKYFLIFLLLLVIIQPVLAEITYETVGNPTENNIDNMYAAAGNDYLDKGEYSNALGSFTYALQQNPKNTIALNGEGIALSKLGRDNEAIVFFDKVLLLEPNNVNALQNKALSLGHLGKFEESVQASDKALTINSKNIDVLITKSSNLFRLGKYQDALQTSEQALLIDPKNAAAWTNKGNSLSGLQRYSEAVQAYDKVIEFAPPQSPVLEGAKQNKILAQNMMTSSTQIPGTTVTVSESMPVTKSPLFFSTAIVASLFVGVYWRIKKKI